jgi:predicted PurR-regulated permease PerM
MSVERQILIWVALLAAAWYALYTLGSTVTPFAAGIALGYLLDPVVRLLERFGFNRLGASLLILFFFVLLLVGALLVFAPVLTRQFVEFSSRLPGYVVRLQSLTVEEANHLLDKYGGSWLSTFGLQQQLASTQIQTSIASFVSTSAQWLLNGLKTLLASGGALFSLLSLVVITPVVAFYILVDWDKMVLKLDGWLPLDHREHLRAIAGEINQALAGFLRGQLLVCVLLGLWYSVGLTLIGLDFGFLIGVVGGILSFVPYIGSFTVMILALSVALVQGWPALSLFYMSLGVVVAGQFLEGYVISPVLVGESIGLHPVWLMFALIAFGQLFGFLGLLVAVPAAAALGVIVRHFLGIYLASPLYRGRAPAEEQWTGLHDS